MISFFNKEFIRATITPHNHMVWIQLMPRISEPRPFLTICVDDFMLYNSQLSSAHVEDATDVAMSILSEYEHSRVLVYHKCTHDAYDELTNGITGIDVGEFILYTKPEYKDVYDMDPCVLIGAIPMDNMYISPIRKSTDYQLYYGGLIIVEDVPTLYCVVNVRVDFNIRLFTKIDASMVSSNVMTHMFYIDGRDLKHEIRTVSVPLDGKESLFHRPCRHLFYIYNPMENL